jgi:phenylacetate-coenzyme A ligase PaaK-like adenylate-forming protein
MLKRGSDLQALAPNVVIGSLGEVHHLADLAASGSIDSSSIDHALVILTQYGAKPLSDVARVALWQSFGVPIFELYLSLDHSLLASECEAHEGWHFAPGVGFATLDTGELILDGAGNSGLRTGLSASLDETPCPCGRTSPRILEIEQLGRYDDRYLAVSA